MPEKANDTFFLSPEAVVRAIRIDEGQQVADFHAASGFFTRAAARAVGPGGKVWAVDADRDRLARVKNTAALEGLHNVEIVRGNIEARHGSLLPDEAMDIVLLVNALFTAEHREAAIEEAWRVLKKSGRLAVIDWSDASHGLGPSREHLLTREEARRLLSRGGFVELEEIPAGGYHWGMLLKKKN